MDLSRPGVAGGVKHCALLDLGGAAGQADHHAGASETEAAALVGGVDEVVEHALGDLKVGDHAVAEGAHGDDVGGGAADHRLGFRADREDGAVGAVDRDYGGFVDHDSASTHGDEGVRGAQVDPDVVGEAIREPAKGSPHHRNDFRSG